MSNGKLEPLAVSAIGVASVIVGALLGHSLKLREDRVSLLEDARRQAYVDFLNTRQGEMEFNQARDDERNALAKAVEAEKNGDKKIAEGWRFQLDEIRKTIVDAQHWDLENTSALNRIAIFGDSRAVRSLASYYRKMFGPQLSNSPCHERWKLEVQMYEDMRLGLPEAEPASPKDLALLVLKCTPSD
jgi:hypothetical protein